MAGIQPARVGVGETIEEFMARRGREAAWRQAAEAAGRDTWAASNGTGQGWAAPRTADVVALGTRVLDARERQQLAAAQTAPIPHRAEPLATLQPVSASSSQPGREAGSRYGNLYAPPPRDLAGLRRQQAEHARITREISNQNSWLAIPALAPAAVVLGLGATSALGTGALGSEAATAPLSFLEREAWQRGAQKAAQALDDVAKTALRKAARASTRAQTILGRRRCRRKFTTAIRLNGLTSSPMLIPIDLRTYGLCEVRPTLSRRENGRPSAERSRAAFRPRWS